VLILRKDQRVWKRTDTRAHFAEDSARQPLAGRPEIDDGHLPSAGDDRISQADLSVQLAGACLHGQARATLSQLRGLVDDPYAHAQQRQPQANTKPVGPAPTMRTSVSRIDGARIV
jgi:hypothetical protein